MVKEKVDERCIVYTRDDEEGWKARIVIFAVNVLNSLHHGCAKTKPEDVLTASCGVAQRVALEQNGSAGF